MDITSALMEGLKVALKDVVKELSDPELIAITADIATTSASIVFMPAGPDKTALIEETKGQLVGIAEKHSLNLTGTAMDQLKNGLEVGLAILSKLVLP